MVQRYITGKVVACDFVANKGEIIAYYEGAHYRTDAPDGTGYVVDFRAVEPTPELFVALTQITSHTEYSGPGLLQCVICADTGSCYFLELNPRLSAGTAEVVNAGMDLPLIALHNGLGSNLPPAYQQAEMRYQLGAHAYWLERDLRGWLKHRRELTWSESARWIRSMITDLFTSDTHINWSWRDPAPTARILTGHLRAALSARLAPLRPTAQIVRAYLLALRSGHRLPAGSLTDLYTQEFRDRRYVLNRAAKSANIFKAMQRGQIIICLVGLHTCRRILVEHGDKLRANSVDLTDLFPKGILRKLEGEDHRHYRQALVTAVSASDQNDTPRTDAAIINHWLNKHASQHVGRASSTQELTRTLDKIATALLIRSYFGVHLGTDDFGELMTLFHRLGPDGFVWNVGESQKQTFAEIRQFLLKRLPESAHADSVAPSVMHCSHAAGSLDDVLLGNLIYMVEMGRYDLHSLFRWLLKYAAENPEIIERIAEEAEDVRHCRLATAFVHETLRMDQSERLIRITKDDFVFDGYFFPRNAIVRLCLWESHKREENFAKPFEFVPQRFLDADYALDRFAPFGLNQHRCPMADPVIQMGVSLIQTLALNFRVEPVAETSANRGPYHWQPGEDFSVILTTQRNSD
jgi:cytochrome P450